MPKLIMTKGLPGSGKTTEASKICAESGNTLRVNRDDLRNMMLNGKWSGKREGYIVDAEKAIVAAILQSGQNVVVDDTNLFQKHHDMWKQVAATCNVAMQVVDMTHVPIETCIERDRVRKGDGRVGRGVIENMALAAGLIKFDDRPIVIVDVDGTLANINHRLHYIQGPNKDWHSFFSEAFDDGVYGVVADWVNELSNNNCIVVLSGRPAKYAYETDKWLRRHVTFSHLFMRGSNDRRDDSIVKQEILSKLPKEKIKFVIDDRARVCDMWRSEGLHVYQVAEGNY